MKTKSPIQSLLRAACTVILLLAACPHVFAQKIAVVVSAKNPVTALSSEVVSDLYLRRATHFPGAGEAVLIDQPVNSAMYEDFYREVAHKTPGQVQSYWSRLVYTGKGRPPKQMSGSAEIKKQVASNPNSIAYVEDTQVSKEIKSVLVIAK